MADPVLNSPGRAGSSLAPATSLAIPVALLAFAALGWWWSIRMAGDMRGDAMGDMGSMGHDALSLGAFLIAWLAMMTAMMFPAISPVVKLYARAAGAGRVAPLPFFVVGYIAVWTSLGLPAYVAWRALMGPIAETEAWAARSAGGVLLAAAAWQVTPFKSVCLRGCRSPMSLFLRFGGAVSRRAGAFRMGVMHAGYCVGCCWALMAVLVAVGTMNLAWMAALAVLIFLEKNARDGERIALVAAAALAVLGGILLVQPSSISALT